MPGGARGITEPQLICGENWQYGTPGDLALSLLRRPDGARRKAYGHTTSPSVLCWAKRC
jgi:hypothetical protein